MLPQVTAFLANPSHAGLSLVVAPVDLSGALPPVATELRVSPSAGVVRFGQLAICPSGIFTSRQMLYPPSPDPRSYTVKFPYPYPYPICPLIPVPTVGSSASVPSTDPHPLPSSYTIGFSSSWNTFQFSVDVTVFPGPPGKPENLTELTKTENYIQLSYSSPEPYGTLVTAFMVHYRKYGEATWSNGIETPGPGTEYTVHGLEQGTMYEVQLKARNQAGYGQYSSIGRFSIMSSMPMMPPWEGSQSRPPL